MKKKCVCIVMLVTITLSWSCVSNDNLIKTINSKVNNSDTFVSISIARAWDSVYGRIFSKNKDRIMKISIVFRDTTLLDFNEENICDLDYVGYSITDFQTGYNKSIQLSKDGSIIYVVERSIEEKYEDIYDFLSWEDSPRGIAIASNQTKLKYVGQNQASNLQWDVFQGTYDLTHDINGMSPNGMIGTVTIRVAQERNTVMEEYINKRGEKIVLRRFWIDEDISLSLEDKTLEFLLDYFMSYYKKAQFEI